MMKNNKKLIIAIACVFLLLVGVIVSMAVAGRFSTADDDTTAQTQTEAVGAFRAKNNIPDEAVAVVYDKFSFSSEDDTDAQAQTAADRVSLLQAEFEQLAEKGFNTLIFDPSALTKADLAGLGDYFEAANAAGFYYGIYADLSLDSFDAAAIAVNNNMDFVIIGGIDESMSSFTSKVTSACEQIKRVDSVMRLGICPTYNSKLYASVKALVSDKTVSFVYVRQAGRSEAETESFTLACQAWMEENAELWLCHDLKGLNAVTSDEAAAIISLIGSSSEMPLCSGIAFAPFADIENATALPASDVLSYIKKRETYLADKEFTVTNYKKTAIEVTESSVTFRGTSSPSFELTCDGKAVERAANGDFSIDCKLTPGTNTIKFVHKDKTYTYKVTYKVKLLKSVSPSDSLAVPGGMNVEVSAVALKGAAVTASFGGKSYSMKQGGAPTDDEEASPNSDTDFATYAVTIVMPGSTSQEQNLGRISVTAKYQSLSETLTGASVKINAEIPVAPVPATEKPTTTKATTTQAPETEPPTVSETVTDENGSTVTVHESSTWYHYTTTTAPAPTATEPEPTTSGTKYTPYKNNGLGKATVCEIIDDYVEVYPGNTNTTYSMPNLSPLPKGTFDYVTGTVTCDGDKYYILSSGVKVPVSRDERLASGANGTITHVKITNSGYMMPSNTIRVASTDVTSGETRIVLDMNWKVPFNCELIGQSYKPVTIAGNVRNVGVSSLNCKGLQITFHNTATAEGSIPVFADSVLASGKWSKGSGNSVVLTLPLTSAGKFYGYTYYYDSNDDLVISVKHKPSSSLSGFTIMLDAGHGGLDSGAVCSVSATGYSLEKNINLSIAKKVKELLEAQGAKVIMTRSSDSWVCYAERNELVRRHNPDMFIAIHCDSSSDASPIGTSAYYYSAYSQPLCKAVHNSIVNAYKTEIYKDKPNSVLSRVDRGANFYAFRVTRVEQCPAILIEYGFVSNTMECSTLQSAANRDILAQATVDGIKSYVASS